MGGAEKKPPIKKLSFACVVIFFILTLSSCSLPAPYLSIVSIMPPKNFDSVLIINGSIEIPSHRSSVAWETYDTFWLWELYENAPPEEPYLGIEIETAVLRITANGETFNINIKPEIFDEWHNTITLNIRNKGITYGTPLSRDIPLISLRVILLLAVASGLFYFFGYRKKRSWIALYAIRLPGAIFISCMIAVNTVDPYRSTWPFFLPFFSIPILLLTLMAMCIAINERKRTRTALYVVASFIINYVLYFITQRFLPF